MTSLINWAPRSTGPDAQFPLPAKEPKQAHVSTRWCSEHISESDEKTVRDGLPSELLPYADTQTVRRFICATNGNLHLAAKRLAATIVWRNANKPEKIVCHACAKDPKSHYMHIVGYDNLRRPIIYSCLAAATNKVFQDNHDHMIQTFETAIKCMPPGVEQWVWLCDFHGFGMADVNPKLARAFLHVSAEHYPERLGLFLVVDAPTLFSVLWQAISAFVDKKTYTKIRFLPFDLSSSKSQLKGCLEEHCEPSTVEWLVNEMKENRHKETVRAKAYNMEAIHSAASEGKLTPLQDKHDLRGVPALLEHYKSSPAVLEPQALTRPK